MKHACGSPLQRTMAQNRKGALGRVPSGGVSGRSKAASERAHRVRCSEGAALRRSPAISGLGSGCEIQLLTKGNR